MFLVSRFCCLWRVKLGVVAHTIIPALRRVRQEDHEFLGYTVRPYLKKKRGKRKEKCSG
jgi:hypothetical protein